MDDDTSGVDVADVLRALDRCLSPEGIEKCLFLRQDFVVAPLRPDTVKVTAQHIAAAQRRSNNTPLHVTWVLGTSCPGLLPLFLSEMVGLDDTESSDIFCASVRVLQMLTSPAMGDQIDVALAPRMALRVDATSDGDVILRCSAMPMEEWQDSVLPRGVVDAAPISALYLSAKTLCENDVEYGTFLKSLEAIHIVQTAQFAADGARWMPKTAKDTEAFSRLCGILGQSSSSVLTSAYHDPPGGSAHTVIGTPLMKFLVEWLVDRCNLRLAALLPKRQKNTKAAQMFSILHCCGYGEEVAIKASSETLGIPLIGTFRGGVPPEIISDVADTCHLVAQLFSVSRRAQWASDLSQSLVLRCVALQMRRPSRMMHVAEALSLYGTLLKYLPGVRNHPDVDKVAAVCAHFLPTGSYLVDVPSATVNLSRHAITTLRVAATRVSSSAIEPPQPTPQKKVVQTPTKPRTPTPTKVTPTPRARTPVRFEDLVTLTRSSVLRSQRSHADPMMPTPKKMPSPPRRGRERTPPSQQKVATQPRPKSGGRSSPSRGAASPPTFTVDQWNAMVRRITMLALLQRRVLSPSSSHPLEPSDTVVILRSLVMLGLGTDDIMRKFATEVFHRQPLSLSTPLLVHLFFAIGNRLAWIDKRVGEVAKELEPWALSSVLTTYSRSDQHRGVPHVLFRLASPAIMRRLTPDDASAILKTLGRMKRIIPEDVDMQKLVKELWETKSKKKENTDSRMVTCWHLRALLNLGCSNGTYYAEALRHFCGAPSASVFPFFVDLCRSVPHATRDPHLQVSVLTFLVREAVCQKDSNALRGSHTRELLRAATLVGPRTFNPPDELLSLKQEDDGGDRAGGVVAYGYAFQVGLVSEKVLSDCIHNAVSQCTSPREAAALAPAIPESHKELVRERLLVGLIHNNTNDLSMGAIALLALSLAKMGFTSDVRKLLVSAGEKSEIIEGRVDRNMTVLSAATLLHAMAVSGVCRGSLLVNSITRVKFRFSWPTPPAQQTIIHALLGLSVMGEDKVCAERVIKCARGHVSWGAVSTEDLRGVMLVVAKERGAGSDEDGVFLEAAARTELVRRRGGV